MGYGRLTNYDWDTRYNSMKTATRSVQEIYSSTKMDPSMDPKNIKLRESRDSASNPQSTPIIIGMDVTGSMGDVIGAIMAKDGALHKLFSNIYDKQPVTDPHLMVMGIGDVETDQAPLQVSQFEASIVIADQLEKVWLEGSGGGNKYESYILPWYFAATRTSIDCFESRGKKGLLFTVGDEKITPHLTEYGIKKVFGTNEQVGREGFTAKQLLKLVEEKWDVFHVVVEEGDYARRDLEGVLTSWKEVLGQRVLRLKDKNKLAQVIVAAIQANEGLSQDEIMRSWDAPSATVIKHALEGTDFTRAISL